MKPTEKSAFNFLAGGGEMGALMRGRDHLLSKAAGFQFHFVKPVESDDLTRVLAQIAAPP